MFVGHISNELFVIYTLAGARFDDDDTSVCDETCLYFFFFLSKLRILRCIWLVGWLYMVQHERIPDVQAIQPEFTW